VGWMTVTRVQAWRYEPQGAAKVLAGRKPVVEPSVEFADLVRRTLDGPVLRYSQRTALLSEAERRGIGRFDANLIIASVLHGSGKRQEYQMAPRSYPRWLTTVLVVLVLQAAIVVGAWWVVH
jgi:hypothetical protein